jgi:hypothetical protein
MEHKTWVSGLNGYKKHILSNNEFITILTDCEVKKDRDITSIFQDHIGDRNHVEVLYSGGTDSELVLLTLLKAKIPFTAITMVIKVDGCILNTHDLYYSEKFCREHNIEQKKIDFDAGSFYGNGDYLNYLTPYRIIEPHVASHFWLIEQLKHPIMGGDWPWVHKSKIQKVISPSRLDYSCYELFMADKKIDGIGNMINHSLESTCKFIQLHLDCTVQTKKDHLVKHKMYSSLYPSIENRVRSYGWENCRKNILNMTECKIELIKKSKIVTPIIQWGETIANILETTERENKSFV